MWNLSLTCFACCICLACVAKSLSGFELNPNIHPTLLCHKRSSGSVVRVSDKGPGFESQLDPEFFQ